MNYISVLQAAEKWGISERRVQKLCEDALIEGALRFGCAWTILKDTEKPTDARIKGGRYVMPRKEPEGGGGHSA